MNTCENTALYTALASIWMIMGPPTADAVQLSTDGRGQVLLYPYYTTRADAVGNAYGTLVSVVNPTAFATGVRVKFLEGKNNREVMSFNLFLSPFDVWTAAILPDTASGGAKVGTVDVSCTLPPFSASPTAPYRAFTQTSFSGASDDGAGTTLDRTNEGFFEIIQMASYGASSATAKAVTHVNGVPPCGASLTDAQAQIDAQLPTGGLFGAGTLINVGAGTDYSYDAVALANFYQIGPDYNPIGTTTPDLAQAAPPVSTVLAPNGSTYESLWTSGSIDAVSAVLIHDSVLNEFVLDTATKSATDWVLTMPTKDDYVARGAGNAARLFQRNFNGMAGSCDDIEVSMWDREERTLTISTVPGAPADIVGKPCWAANVMSFNGTGTTSRVLGSTNVFTYSHTAQNGWTMVRFPTNIGGASATVHQLINQERTTISGRGLGTINNTVTYTGLPVIGFAVVSYANGTLVVGNQSVLSNYGGNFVHKTSTLIE